MKINDHIKFIYVKIFFYYKNQNKFNKYLILILNLIKISTIISL